MVSPAMAREFISGQETAAPMVELGWNSVSILELTTLPNIEKDHWVFWVREAVEALYALNCLANLITVRSSKRKAKKKGD